MTIDHEEFTPLVIDNDMTAAEFKVATREALEKKSTEFEFYGHTVEVTDALEVITELEDGRTYH